MTAQGDSVFHGFDTKHSLLIPTILVLVAACILGVLTGYFIAPKDAATSLSANGTGTSTNGVAYTKGQVIGSADTSAFKDTTDGVLQNGGVDGEGQFHLVRPGGDSQNVYITSSTVDLSQLLNKKIRVWGATQTAKHAGWLMDVGRVEVLE